MHQCTNCGETFEGVFCPNCGTKWQSADEKVCPACKAQCPKQAKFCTACGYNFETSTQNLSQPTTAQAKIISVLFTLCSYLPVVLFALLSVLTVLFYLAPVVVTKMDGVIMSSKNVFELLNDKTVDMSGEMTFLIVFWAISLVAAALLAVFTVKQRYHFIKNIRTVHIFGVISALFTLAIFIIGCVINGKIDEYSEMGLVSAGACPALIITFGIIFFVFSACALVAKFLLGKFLPTLKQTEDTYIKNYVQRKAEFLAQNERPKLNMTDDMQQAVNIKKADNTFKLTLIFTALSLIILFYGCIMSKGFYIIIYSVLNLIFEENSWIYSQYTNFITIHYPNLYTFILNWCIPFTPFLFASLIVFIFKFKNDTVKNLKLLRVNKLLTTLVCIAVCILYFAFFAIIVSQSIIYIINAPTEFAGNTIPHFHLIFFILYSLICPIGIIIANAQNKKNCKLTNDLRLQIYGNTKIKGLTPNVTVEQVNEQLRTYKTEKLNLKLAKRDYNRRLKEYILQG